MSEVVSRTRLVISYSRNSFEPVGSIVNELRRLGHEVWYDGDIPAGEDWWEFILSKIRECEIFVYMLDLNSIVSIACKKELAYAIALRKKILPIRISKEISLDTLPLNLSELQTFDFFASDHNIYGLNTSFLKLYNKPTNPLPDPLPLSPNPPNADLAKWGKLVHSGRLSEKVQKQLVLELGKFHRDETTRPDALELLERLKARTDLNKNTIEEIDDVLMQLKRAPEGSLYSSDNLETVAFVSGFPENPFKRIALCLSGGGYRTTAFHLGALAYLNRVKFNNRPLLTNVRSISTVSGGTITGIVYALMTCKGKAFDQIYSFLVEKFQKLDLVRTGVTKLTDYTPWLNKHKRRNLVNAFAEIYEQEFTNGETFNVFEDIQHSHLEEVMFNATDFSSGITFRFQSDGRFGNYYFPVKRAVNGEVKLSDIMAASSSFPGGFEPIEWPGDFIHDESFELAEEASIMPRLGLMDGSIYDNHGIDSILLSENRMESNPFDLIIVSDVTSPQMRPFMFSENKVAIGWRKQNVNQFKDLIARWYNQLSWLIIVVFISSILLLITIKFEKSVLSGILYSTSTLSVLLILTMSFLKRKIGFFINKISTYIVSTFRNTLPFAALEVIPFSKISFGALEPLILDRINSLVTFVGQVFLKTRRYEYGKLYDSRSHQFKRMSNLIRDITREDFENKRNVSKHDEYYFQNLPGCDQLLQGNYDQVIGPHLGSVVDTALAVGTAIWFSKSEQTHHLNGFLIIGQASMCFSLLRYLVELKYTPGNGYSKLSEIEKLEIENLWDQCIEDWKKFKGTPYFLLKEREE